MLKARSGLRWLGILAVAARCFAQEMPAPRDVDLTAADGTKLKATYFSAGKPGPGVLLLHQCGPGEGSRRNWAALAPRLAAAGINVLTFDYRGHGESGGTWVFGDEQPKLLWPGDIEMAFAYLESQPEVKRDTIGAGGESCGGGLAIRLAQRHKEVRTLVVMSTPQLSGSDRQFVRHANEVPMFIAVANDDIAPAPVMEWLYQLSPNPGSRFVRYEAGGHGVEMFTSHKELVGTTADWFVQTLITTPGSAPPVAAGKPLPPAMIDIIDAPGGAAKVSAELAEARKKYPTAKLFDPWLVRVLGFAHFQEGDKKGAIEIMKLNVAAEPAWPLVYWDLADLYMRDGQTDLARQAAKKQLQLLDSDTKDSEETRTGLRGFAEEEILKKVAAKP